MEKVKEKERKRERGAAQRFPAELDRLVHERIRLGMLSALAAADRLSFNDLKSLLATSDGNLSVHARKLEEAGYVACSKSFEDRTPRTEYQMTDLGRHALSAYLDQMEQIIEMTRK
jgi:DNA-binding HxlR family transcriptional regulator